MRVFQLLPPCVCVCEYVYHRMEADIMNRSCRKPPQIRPREFIVHFLQHICSSLAVVAVAVEIAVGIFDKLNTESNAPMHSSTNSITGIRNSFDETKMLMYWMCSVHICWSLRCQMCNSSYRDKIRISTTTVHMHLKLRN